VNPDSLRDEIRKLKKAIRDDPTVRARYDTNRDGEIDAEEWAAAVQAIERELETRESTAGDTGIARRESESLVDRPAILVKQEVELTELALDVETRNRYTVLDTTTQAPVGSAEEVGSGLSVYMLRQLPGLLRPVELSIWDDLTGVRLTGARGGSLVPHFVRFVAPPALDVALQAQALGQVQLLPPPWWSVWRWWWSPRAYTATLGGANRPLRIQGSYWHPWTFPVFQGERQVASILKRWSGLFRELATDADSFVLRFEDARLSRAERYLLLAAALLIDYDFFEKRGRRR
jgi:hypothetical protein